MSLNVDKLLVFLYFDTLIFGYFSLGESGKVIEPSERRGENRSRSEELNLKIEFPGQNPG